MDVWRLIIVSLLFALPRPTYAVDHQLFHRPIAAAGQVDATSTASPPAWQRPRPPKPELIDGALWICAVGQGADENWRAFRRAKDYGYGYWRFAAHAKCPAGVYLAEVRGGRLIATGADPWTEPSRPSPVVKNRGSTQPGVYYATPAPLGSGFDYGLSPADWPRWNVASGDFAIGGSCSGVGCGY